MDPVAPYETTLATVAAGRTAAVAQLRQLATRLEELPLVDVAEVLVLLEPTLDDVRRWRPSRSNARPAGSKLATLADARAEP